MCPLIGTMAAAAAAVVVVSLMMTTIISHAGIWPIDQVVNDDPDLWLAAASSSSGAASSC